MARCANVAITMGTRERAKPGPLSQAIARMLDAERKKQGLSQADLGERAGVSQQLMSDYLGGRKSPTPDQVQDMCDALGLEFLAVIAKAERTTRS